MSYTVGSIVNAMPNYFSSRLINSAQCCENVRKSVLELTENYPFPGLQVTGPTVQLTLNLAGPYLYNYFLQPADAGLEINELDSFFIYYQGVPILNQQNAGFNIRYKTINDLEILLNTPGLPTNWTRYNGELYFSMSPDQAYYIYLRYQKEHPFPNAGLATAPNDPILMPNSWQDIVELCTAERMASDLNLEDRRVKFHTRVYGDPKWQATGGTQGSPGLLFSRTSQKQRDQETTTKSMRIMRRAIMR